MSKKVLVPIADGTEEIEATCIIDVLRRAGAEVTVASVGQSQITASRGVKIVGDTTIDKCADKNWDAIALPGGLAGAENLRDCQQLTEMLKDQQQSGRLYAAICASPAVVFQHHGLLEGRKATCHPNLREKLDSANASDEPVVVDGNCVTSQGPGTALQFALKLVELLFSRQEAEKIADAMLVK